MAIAGDYDADLHPDAWYDPVIVSTGWFDWSAPFSHPLLDLPTSPPPPPPAGGWIFISSWG